MGSTVCKKCNVPLNYYNSATTSLPSCRVHTCNDIENCICGGNGNCYHEFEFQFYFNNCISKKNKCNETGENSKLI